MTLLENIKHHLLLNRPLGIYIPLAALVLLLPSITFPVALFLFLSYFLVNYLWRRHLKKQDKLGDSSSGLYLLLVCWGVTAFAYYDTSTPDAPRVALYETSQPEVFSDTDNHPAPEATKESQEAEVLSSNQRNGRFSTLSGMLVDKVESVHDSSLSCAFLRQHQLIVQCSSSNLQETVRVELDNNSATVELLISEKKPEECIRTPCQVWLIQTTQANINQFREVRNANEEQGKAPPTAEATLIAKWGGIVTPVIVFNTSSNGWRHLRVSDTAGNMTAWTQP